MAQVHVTYKRRRIDSSKPSLVKKQSCKNGGDHRFCFLPQSNSESAGWGKSLQHRGYYTTPPLLNEQIVLLNI
ncbi:hypothetical protein DUF49_24525 [Salmonella enterica]|nr:hypothetical protein [Salmonella enterica]EBR9724397.1 hypothetical protein [Salmonella enterica subsp. enterica serovar Agona]EAQ0818743.1 hypothetical protein [Salmonella enterica]EAT4560392.1 hypothetical protein [Salmonella enterica]EBK8629153.1 hypothetical protein [Salmonella enterica]